MVDHRKVPIPYPNVGRGYCKWCGREILELNGQRSKRRLWHPDCVAEYDKLVRPHRWVRARDLKTIPGTNQKAIYCAWCGVCETGSLAKGDDSQAFHLDHIVPLIDGGSHNHDNLQWLCVSCHHQKTAEEARRRRELSQ